MFKQAQSLLLQLALSACVYTIGVIAPAHANMYPFTFVGTGVFGTTGSVTINGILTTDTTLDSANSSNTPPGFDITGITGTYDAFAITGLVQPSTCATVPLCNILNTLNPPAEYVFY